MKTIKTYCGQPILEIVEDTSGGLKVEFGVYRDRESDMGWNQMRRVNLSTVKGVD